ncbi:MAG: glutathione-disulfide reductase [Pseudomonadota bacterium]
MSIREVDFFVIGGGSGGVRAARIAAELGADVVLAEYAHLGGTCVNVGCVPKKLMVYAAQGAQEIDYARAYGWQQVSAGDFEWRDFIARKDAYLQRLRTSYQKTLENAGVEIVTGQASFTGTKTLAVGDQIFRAEHILIATGSTPFIPDVSGASAFGCVSSDMFALPQLPRELVIVGGGYIAVEFACIFRSFGVDVTLLYRGDLFLRGFDDDIRIHLAKEMREQGIDIYFNTTPTAIYPGAVELGDGKKIPSDCVLFAVGRVPLIAGLKLEKAGIICKDGAIEVDDLAATSAPGVYAIGDVTNYMNLTPVAIEQGQALAKRLFSGSTRPFKPEAIASAVFTNPPVGTVGLSEQQAQKLDNVPVKVYKSIIKPMKTGFIEKETRALVKLVVNGANERILGVHVVGPDAPEIIQLAATAIQLEARKPDFDDTVAVHPTLAEELVTLDEVPSA